MDFIQSFRNKTILIPLLQRDYVQGGREEVIGPFVDSLLEKDTDLNYIYGYEQDGCFVPIDGQQRLTTLWLLYLYLFSRKQKKGEFNISMKFASREYADDFCERLSAHLEELLSHVGDNEPLDDTIADQNWFIRSWVRNASVSNMLRTLRIIHRKINVANFPSIWSRLVETPVPGISFAFLQMDSGNGLDDDIYIKMNGRGRKLSAFENLKSYMDEYVATLPFAEKWKTRMDNAWTDMFWTNRNRHKEHPEEIDGAQLYCLYNLLILYHSGKDELADTLADIKENRPYIYEELAAFVGKSERAEEDEILSSIIERLQKAGNFPLVWFERLHLMSEGFYRFAFDKIERLVAVAEEFNSLGLYVGASPTGTTTATFQLCMCEGSFNRTLPLLYALTAYSGGATPLYDWMRTMRNLILNTDISRKELPLVMLAIDTFGAQCKERDIYGILQSDNDVKAALKGFSQRQVDEEIVKASLPEYYMQLTSLENGRFFSGCVGLLFRLLSCDGQNGCDLMTQENVAAYSTVLLELFDGSDNGISTRFDDERFLLRRALMSCPPYRFGKWRSQFWSFNNGINEWREYVNDGSSDIASFRHLMKNVLVPAVKSGRDIYCALSEYVEGISLCYENDIMVKDDCSYRYHFIHHPGVWGYMATQRCAWRGNFDIELKTSNGNNSNRMELRTMSLFLDYKYNGCFTSDYEGWSVDLWPRGISCLVFNFSRRVDGRTVAIDVYFCDDKGGRNGEDCYAFDLFVRPTHPDGESEAEEKAFADDDYKTNVSLFSGLIPELMCLFVRKADGRLHSGHAYARHELKPVLRDVMCGIKTALTF